MSKFNLIAANGSLLLTSRSPNMKQIVIAGHSLGGQMVQRYAAVGNVLRTNTPVSYWTANPDSFLWFATQRPRDSSACSTYDAWRDGFSSYTNRYGADIVSQGRAAALARYSSRRIAYGHGTQDFGDDSSTCGANTTGINRSERFFNLIRQFPISCSSPSTPGGSCATVDYVNVGHDALGMMSSSAGQARLFRDNFNGDASLAYDVGYPRIQGGDDPYPNPALAPAAKNWTTQVYPGNMSYQGCWTNSNTSSLAYNAYQGNSNNTIEGCTSTCRGLGYSTAGMAWGYDCYCDSAISYNAIQIADGACSFNCSGNSNEYCGGEIVLAVYSNNTLSRNKQPSSPVNVSSYNYVGCMTDDTNNRALAGQSTSGVVSLESCAKYCSDYSYFGVENHNECYCGNSLVPSSIAVPSTDCNLACTGNSAEICGGSLRLSVYNTSSVTSNITCTNNASNGTIYQTSSGNTYQIFCSSDSYGGDISGVSTPSLAACINACESTSGCIDISYTGGTCWLKSSLSPYYPNSAVASAKKISVSCSNGAGNGTIVTASSGGSYQVLCATDSYGGDISGANSPSLSDCLNTCDQTPACIDVSYTGGKCWLKSGPLSPFYANTAVISGRKLTTSSSSSSTNVSCANNASDGTTVTAVRGGKYTIRCGTDHYGGDVASADVASFADCVDACEANAACVDVSYLGGGASPSCWLKGSLSGAYANANVATAEKVVS